MYEHVTRFVADIDAGTFDERAFSEALYGPTLVGFWRETDELGCCSNWHPAGFEYRGQGFATSEHWMMWQ